MGRDDDYIKIATLENEVEARLLDSILTERNIPHMIGTYHDLAYDGIYQMVKGWGYVSSEKIYEKDIKEILSDLRKDMSSDS